MVVDGVIGTGLVVVRIVALGTDWDLVRGGEGLDTRLDLEERLADPGSRGEDSDGVEVEDESESEKRRGVPSLRERLPLSAGLGVGGSSGVAKTTTLIYYEVADFFLSIAPRFIKLPRPEKYPNLTTVRDVDGNNKDLILYIEGIIIRIQRPDHAGDAYHS
ncbi:hypothetical protein LOTGIDRAFT_164117 [Lottia gigantea]|uniref:Uncharacterized protein n=1 Tax=Lottia gigantea TaxID=225164 RepID=V4A6A0_LOTGI|nr:hypothetical protein LOTGIDRAFT_164117 [Lottia gigantea]ESO90530.1 hypothetical protein LOTGIDRAFT_164117 [Lottia gigantea]